MTVVDPGSFLNLFILPHTEKYSNYFNSPEAFLLLFFYRFLKPIPHKKAAPKQN